MEAITAVRGTNDLVYAQAARMLALENTLRGIAHKYGYEEIRTPVFEHTELFTRGIGEDTDIVSKEMFTFQDRGERSLTLRPEGTASMVRAFVEHHLFAERGINKIFYTGAMYRAERPQKGRYREFHQFGVEVIGSPSPLVDAEIILFNLDVFKTLGLSGLTLTINSVGCPKCNPAYLAALRETFKNDLPSLCETCRTRYDKNVLRMLDCKVESCQPILAKAPAFSDHLCDECKPHFETVKQELANAGIQFTVNPRLVRGLDYYTKTAFEISANMLGAQNAVCGGGRYDNLIGVFNNGKSFPAMGSAFGLERILLALGDAETKNTIDVFVVAFKETADKLMPTLSMLRAAGRSANADYNVSSIKSQLKTADKLGAKYTLILGPEEAAAGECMLRNMTDKTEKRVKIADAAGMIV
ncbi:MAG: histidine--tRNA ligase [Spirochaetes bacterium]|nr:histidine--tRNA ligase [Spirochaetota bacterium]